MKDSGEQDVYPELAEYVFKRAGGLDAVTKPGITFEDVGGLETVKEEIRNKVVYPLKNPSLASEYGAKISGGILMYGPPGCGKTYIARATAGECEASFFNVKSTDLMSPVEGETERRLHDIFERASRNPPAVIFFDEIDAIARQRSSAAGGAERRLINQFLTEMDGFEKREGVVVLAATNAPWDIDPALRRAGRFSDQIFLPPPDAKSREDVFRIHMKKLPIDQSVDPKELAASTEGYSPADIKAVCDEAAKIPWKETLETGRKRPIQMSDFKVAIERRQSSLLPWLQQASKQVKISGEESEYPELAAILKTYEAKLGAGRASEEMLELDRRKKEAEAAIEEIKERYQSGELDDDTLHFLIRDHEKTLIEINARIRIAKDAANKGGEGKT